MVDLEPTERWAKQDLKALRESLVWSVVPDLQGFQPLAPLRGCPVMLERMGHLEGRASEAKLEIWDLLAYQGRTVRPTLPKKGRGEILVPVGLQAPLACAASKGKLGTPGCRASLEYPVRPEKEVMWEMPGRREHPVIQGCRVCQVFLDPLDPKGFVERLAWQGRQDFPENRAAKAEEELRDRLDHMAHRGNRVHDEQWQRSAVSPVIEAIEETLVGQECLGPLALRAMPGDRDCPGTKACLECQDF